MTTTTVNGRVHELPDGLTLMTWLREVLDLTSVKHGCDDGSCGTCLVVVDGRTVKACTRQATTFAGKQVTTAEGLRSASGPPSSPPSSRRARCSAASACRRFVMTTTALLDADPDPSREEVVRALRSNLCRCTGYRMVEDAVLRTGRILRGEEELAAPTEQVQMSDRVARPDAAAEAARHAACTPTTSVSRGWCTPRRCARRTPGRWSTSSTSAAARAHPDCLAVLTASDVPENIIGHLVRRLGRAGGRGRHHPLRRRRPRARRVPSTSGSLDEVIALIDVGYTVLEPVTSPEQALAPGAPLLHPGGNVLTRELVDRGDADAALAASAFVVTNIFHTPWQEHAFMEPECAVAQPWGDGGVEVFTAGQSVYDEQREIARMLGLPPGKVHAHSMLVGGGFGGKEDMSVQHHAALAAWRTGRPVKVQASRATRASPTTSSATRWTSR